MTLPSPVPGQATQEVSVSDGIDVTASDTVTVLPGRVLAIVCTVAGNVKVGLSGVSAYTYTFPVAVGLTILPFRVSQVFVTGTTATATYANLQ